MVQCHESADRLNPSSSLIGDDFEPQPREYAEQMVLSTFWGFLCLLVCVNFAAGQSDSPSAINRIAFSTFETESSKEMWVFTPLSAGSQCPAQPNPRKEQRHRLPGDRQRRASSEVLDSPSESFEARKECKSKKVMNSTEMKILRSTKV
jgi:hypothetical protein